MLFRRENQRSKVKTLCRVLGNFEFSSWGRLCWAREGPVHTTRIVPARPPSPMPHHEAPEEEQESFPLVPPAPRQPDTRWVSYKRYSDEGQGAPTLSAPPEQRGRRCPHAPLPGTGLRQHQAPAELRAFLMGVALDLQWLPISLALLRGSVMRARGRGLGEAWIVGRPQGCWTGERGAGLCFR